MNKKMLGKLTLTVFLIMIIFTVMGCGNNGSISKDDSTVIPEVRVAQQGAYDTWPTWELAQNGEDEANGFKINMTYFDSGPQQIEALGAGQFDMAAVGPTPAMVGALAYDLQIVGIAVDESTATAILARPDNPIFNTKGVNPEFPDIYGTAEDLKGKDVFVTTVTTGDVLLINYLKALGLTQKDINVTNMEQPQMLSAFQSGKGDAAVMWSPFTYTGFDKGWKVVADASTAKAPAVIFLVASKKFCDEKPELVEKFVDAYINKAMELKNNEANLTEEYIRYLNEWSALTWDEKTAKIDMEKHLVYDVKDQLEWFDRSNGPSKVEALLDNASAAFTSGGIFTEAEREEIVKFNFINTSFLENINK